MLVLVLALLGARMTERETRHKNRQRKLEKIFAMLREDKELEYLLRKELQTTPEEDVAFKNSDRSMRYKSRHRSYKGRE